MPKREPLVWRVPPWQAAALLVLAAGAAAFALYGDPSATVKFICGFVAIVLAAGGVVTARAFLVVDDEGIGWRRAFGEVSVPWAELERIDVLQNKLRISLVVVARGHKRLEIPALLVMPARPMTNPNTVRRLDGIARRIVERRPAGF